MNPKAGKSSLAYGLFGQKGLFLGFEDGTRAISGALAIPVNTWEDLIRDKKVDDGEGGKKKIPSINKQLKDEKVKARYKVLIIDTIDLMYDRIVEYVCKEEGVDKLADIPYGGGYAQTSDILRNQLVEWERMGYRLFFISHAEDKKVTIKDNKGVEREISKFTPTVDKRAFKIVSKMVDNIFFAYLNCKEDGTEERKIFTRETSVYFAGSRFKHLPSELPLDAKEMEKAIAEAIDKEDLTTDDKYVASHITSMEDEFESFEDVKAKVINIVKTKFQANNRMDIVTEATTKHLGEGVKIGGTTEEHINGLEAIYEMLTDKVKELGL